MANISLPSDRLREQREGLKISQADAAARCGVSREMWGRYERGLAAPGGDVLAKMASMGIDVAYVLREPSSREDEFDRRLRILGAAASKAGALATPEREQQLVRDIIWGAEMLQAPFIMTTLDAYIGERTSLARSTGTPPKAGTKQVFKAKVGQVAGGDIHNHKEKKR